MERSREKRTVSDEVHVASGASGAGRYDGSAIFCPCAPRVAVAATRTGAGERDGGTQVERDVRVGLRRVLRYQRRLKRDMTERGQAHLVVLSDDGTFIRAAGLHRRASVDERCGPASDRLVSRSTGVITGRLERAQESDGGERRRRGGAQIGEEGVECVGGGGRGGGGYDGLSLAGRATMAESPWSGSGATDAIGVGPAPSGVTWVSTAAKSQACKTDLLTKRPRSRRWPERIDESALLGVHRLTERKEVCSPSLSPIPRPSNQLGNSVRSS